MSIWSGKSVIVTGAASGIGLALSQLLARHGARVWLADIDEAGATKAAHDIGGDARAVSLNVTDAQAFSALVSQVEAEHGRLDVLFNNAGIGSGGLAHELDFSHYDKAVAVNITGVTNGLVAAYPGMVKRRSGIIVNTASAAGLMGVAAMAPYSMTKHAVVGLTNSVRIEAAEQGVQVCALCPMAIETPILDSDNPPGTPQVWRPDLRGYLTAIGGPPYPVDKFAAYALKKIEQNKGIIVAPFGGRVRVALARIFPGMVTAIQRGVYRKMLRQR